MKLFIANCSKQVHHFLYRVPEATGLRAQPIKEGGQIQVSGELQPEAIDYIVNQHVRYDEIDRAKPFIGLCYSIDKPIPAAKIQKLMIHNQGILEERAEETLRAMALANNAMMENRIEMTAREARHPIPQIGDLEISIVEESRGGTPAKTNFFREGKQAVGGIKVHRSDTPPGRRKG
jgi:hypothetical protein